MLSVFLGSFLVGLSGAMAPGPLMAIAISKSAKDWKAPLKLITGHVLLEAILVLLLLVGVQAIFPLFMRTISLAGGSFLLYMGVSQFFEAKNPSLNMKAKDTKLPLPIQGALVSLSNPYFLLWWFSVGSTFLFQTREYLFLGILLFYFGHILSDISWYAFLGVAGQFLKRPSWKNVYRIVLVSMSMILIGFGVYFLIFAFKGDFFHVL
ncbi:LysE family transporter [Thermotoga sp. SG1]|uniref:LysE family transporter n=1 Tax=Thermotoga sp. SG1 TaxID=126739 RepID=UPI000C793773|nr:LysE family transporter [Thermotoga sp. SG1]PLV57385.1 lysine transporter LysE [Thermotoga sp. SG1]